MLEFLYPTSFFMSLAGLILWSFFKDQRTISGLMQKVFVGGILLYFITVLFSSGTLSVKLLALFRDLITMGFIAQFFRFFKNNKLVFFVMLAVLFGAFQFKGKDYLQSTFATEAAISEGQSDLLSNLDQEAELLLEIKAGNSILEVEEILSEYELKKKIAFHPIHGELTDLDDFYTVNIPDHFTGKIEEIMTAFRANPAVDGVEFNEVFRINPIESKINIPGRKKYDINDPEVAKLWGFEAMNMHLLYKVLAAQKVVPTKKAKVFVVDSGVDAKHEDLKARYRSINRDYDKDTNGHGTHCAGIAAAITNNGKGVASAFPSNEFAELTGVKVMNFMGLITQQRLIEGIIEAIDNGADVISVSIGAPSREAAQEAFQEVVEYANKANAIIVVAAGNSNQNATGFTHANADGVITVSAIDTANAKASFSNMVADLKMGIAAPGVNIYSTVPGSKYKALSGTSMACPYVSGLVGLMKSIQPDLTAAEVYKILKETGKKTKNDQQTGRLIQPAAAITYLLANQSN